MEIFRMPLCALLTEHCMRDARRWHQLLQETLLYLQATRTLAQRSLSPIFEVTASVAVTDGDDAASSASGESPTRGPQAAVVTYLRTPEGTRCDVRIATDAGGNGTDAIAAPAARTVLAPRAGLRAGRGEERHG